MIKSIQPIILLISIFIVSNTISGLENKAVPEAERYSFYGKVTGLGGSLFGIGAEYYFTRSFWIGLNSGICLIPTFNNSRIIYNPSLAFESGYHIIGSVDRMYRVSVGLNATIYFMVPGKQWAEVSDTPAVGFWAGAFAELSYRWFFVRAYLSYDPNAKNPLGFLPSVGIRF